MKVSQSAVAVVGLGYVGLPLALGFAEHFRTYGYDRSAAKVSAYSAGDFSSAEVGADFAPAARKVTFTDKADCLRAADFIIVAVPTPVDSAHKPDFEPLLSASASIGKHLKRGATVIYESTVYPGATEEVCIPELERSSGLKWRTDFQVGYSPERINPGDRERTLRNTVKVVAADDAATLDKICWLYGHVVNAKLHRVSSIKVAEAAKVIENTQRDLNIALMNELSLIFHRIGIDTTEVLETAGTKWNFLPFRPGLVGGHCIGVDPYYLTHKADMLGYHPQVILAGRRINDGMGKYIAGETVKLLVRAGVAVSGCSINVLGLTFKENCPDLRNSRVIDVVRELESYGAHVHVHDPIADPEEAMHEYGVALKTWDDMPRADAIVAAVAHRTFRACPLDVILSKLAPNGLYVDVKCQADAAELARRGIAVWRL